MRAVVFHGPGQLRVEEVADPRAGPGELVVRVDEALTCGTDLKAYLRGHRLFRPPMRFGHEMAGSVIELGEGVTAFQRGDKVVAANSAPCRSCFFCRRGETPLCEKLDSHLSWGAYAEYALIPAHIVAENTHRAEAPYAAAAEPLACVLHGIDAAPVAGDSVVVLGGTGAIGLMFVQALRHAGAATVIAVGRSADRLRLAEELGADYALPAEGDLQRQVKDLTGGRGAGVVIEAAGLPELWELAPELCRRGGTSIMFGGCPGGTRFSVDTGRVHYDALTVRGVFHHTPATYRRALDLIAGGYVKIAPLIGARGGLHDVERLLQQMARRDLIKAAVDPAL